MTSIQKVFVPFYKLNLDSNIHSFMTLHVKGSRGYGYTKMLEMDYDYTLNTSICGNTELEYYINDCNGNFDGPKPKIKNRIEDIFVYIVVGFAY